MTKPTEMLYRQLPDGSFIRDVVPPLIAAALAMPKTHKVTVTFADGKVHEHETRNEASARNYATHMIFRFGKTAAITVSKMVQ